VVWLGVAWHLVRYRYSLARESLRGDDKIFIHDGAVRPGIVSIGIVSIGSIAMAEVSIDIQVASNCWHGNSQSGGGIEAQI